METIVPRSTPLGFTTPLPQPMIIIPEPPTSLQNLTVGEKFEAFVLQGMIKGHAEIDTSFGKLNLNTHFPLNSQTNLKLQIIGKFLFMQLLIISIEGQTPKSALRAIISNSPKKEIDLGQSGTSNIPSNSFQSKKSEPISITLGANVIATKTGTSLTSSPFPSSTSIVKTSSSNSVITPEPVSVKNQIGIGTEISAIIEGAKRSPNVKTGIDQIVNRFSVCITNVLPPSELSNGGGLPSTDTESLIVGESITGVVTISNLQGHAIVQTHTGPITLETPNSLLPGTTVSFTITAPLPPLTIEPYGEVFNHSAEVILETHRWLALDDALQTLNESYPTLGQQILNSILPKPGTTLAANIIFLVSALRNGDIKNWFGDAPMRALQRIKPELMSRLRDDFSQISQLSDDNTSSLWRTYPLPLLNGQDIEQIRLYIKHKSKHEDDNLEPSNHDTRFILDLNLTYIGRLQLDGLLRSNQKQFDLILRTNDPLHQMIQNGIRDIFQKAIEQTGYNGGLSFQAAPAVFTDTQSKRTRPPEVGLIA